MRDSKLDMKSIIKKYDLSNNLKDNVSFDREELRGAILEQLGGGSLSDTKEQQLEISIELCRAYCKMMAEAFDKASRGSSKPSSVKLQIEVVDRYIESLNKEIKTLEKINQDLERRAK